MQVAFDLEIKKLKKQEEKLKEDESNQDRIRKQIKEKEFTLQAQFEDQTYKIKQFEVKVKQMQSYIEEKDSEIDRLTLENESNKRKLK